MTSRDTHSVHVDLLTPEQAREVLAQPDSFFEWCADQLREHARRLMAGEPVGVVEVPRVVDLDAYRKERT